MLSFKHFLYELSKPKELTDLQKSLKSKVTSVDTRDSSWMYSITEVMKKFGFSRLGSGKYASVYGNPKYQYVVKVFMKDSAYLRWINFCLKNRNNRFVPKIKGKVVRLTPYVYAIRLEKLEPTSFSGEFATEYQKWMKDSNYKSNDKEIQVVLDYFGKNKKLLDLHGENVMSRNGQLVIIDPFYNWFNKHKHMDYTIDPDEVDKSLF